MEPIKTDDKVVWLEEMDRSRQVGRRQEPRVFLVECRDLLIARITGRMNAVLDQVERDLFDLAEITTDRDGRNQLMAARDECVSKRALVSFGFKRSYIAAWEAAVPRKTGAPVAGNAPKALGLSLLDNDELEEDIAISKMSAGLERAAEEELFKLTGRVGELLGIPTLDNSANPLRPRLIAEALHAALSDIGTATRAKVVILGLFEQYLKEDLVDVYRSLEQRIARRQGDNDGSAAAKRRTRKTFQPNRPASADLYGTLARLVEESRGGDKAAGAEAAATAQLVPTAPGGPGVMMGYGVAAQPGVAVPLAAGAGGYGGGNQQGAGASLAAPGAMTGLQGGIAGPAGFQGAPGAAPGFQGAPGLGFPSGFALLPGTAGVASGLTGTSGLPGGIGGLPGYPEGVQPVAANHSVMLTSLTALQRGDLSALGPIAQMSPQQFQPEQHNILHSLRNAPFVREVGAGDTVTFDIVAMLFDFIFEDDDIPDLMKGRIGRLQIPVLKVALIDKTFFASRTHPARRLIDSLAEAAQSWVPDGFNNDRLLAEVDGTIQRILDGFESDVGVFQEALDSFSAYLEGERARESELAQASAQVVLARERKEIALSVSLDEVTRRLEGKTVPQPVTTFLHQHWSEVLARVHVRHGESSQEWLAGLATMDELIWSVAPKMSSPERNQLVARLPQLLRRLQSGMDLIQVDSAERNGFFTSLVACHASAVKMGLRSGNRDAEDAAAATNGVIRPHPLRRAADRARPVADGIDAEGHMAPLLLTEVEEEGVQLEELRLDGERQGEAATEAAPIMQDEYAQMVLELQRGACVEFNALEGRKTRCKLAWVSPLKGIYLFTRQPGRQALSVSPEALAAALRAGEATVLSDAPLFDRAVDSLLGALTPG